MSKKFESEDDQFSFAEKYERKDIIFVPHLYNVKWSRDLNAFLSKVFVSPSPFKEDTYLPGRTEQHKLLATIIKEMRDREIKKVFFANLIEDFTPDIIKAGFAENIYGIVHGSNFSKYEPGNSKKLREYEKVVAELATKVFVATKWFSDLLPYETIAMGLPIFEKKLSSRNSNIILFNHRLVKEKNPQKLFELPKEIKNRIVITCPFQPFSSFPEKFKEEFDVRYNPEISDGQYRQFLYTCGFGLSLSDYDNFGYAVIEGMVSGLCYFVPNNNTTAYKEYVIDELRYNSMGDLIEKINYYTANTDKKNEIVLKQQNTLEKFFAENWIQNLYKEI